MGSVKRSEGAAGGFGNLPEGCISHILSLTTPRDACRSAAAGSILRSASESDTVWEEFLPPGYRDVVARADEQLESLSKKELYFRLCRPLLIDNGRKRFAIEKSTGKTCYVLSARDLWIAGSDDRSYLTWGSLPESRFPEVAELHGACWLEIRGSLRASMLSLETAYDAYLVYNVRPGTEGMYITCLGSVTYGAQTSKRDTRIRSQDYAAGRRRFEGKWSGQAGRVSLERVRDDGWEEVALGEFFADGSCHGEVEVLFLEVDGRRRKRGLIVEGIELRPKNWAGCRL